MDPQLKIGLVIVAVTAALGVVGWLVTKAVESFHAQAEANARAIEHTAASLADHERDCSARWAANDEQHAGFARTLARIETRLDGIEKSVREIERTCVIAVRPEKENTK